MSLRRSARVASNRSAASSVSLSVEGGGGASEGEGGEGGGGRRGGRGRGSGRGRGEGGPSSRSPSSSSLVPSPSLPAPPPPIISRRNDEAIVTAAANGNLGEVMRLYDEDNVSLDSTDDDGATALMMASDRGHFPIVHFLDSNGAGLDRTNNLGGWTAIHGTTWYRQNAF